MEGAWAEASLVMYLQIQLSHRDEVPGHCTEVDPGSTGHDSDLCEASQCRLTKISPRGWAEEKVETNSP